MSEDVKQPEPGAAGEETQAIAVPEIEDRIDELAVSMFHALGHQGRLPDHLVLTYKEFKRRKDILRPGPLSAECWVIVTMLAELFVQRKGTAHEL